MTNTIYSILFIVLGYLIGSIPFSYIIPKLYGKDIRSYGSGNVGGTNVMRNMGFLPGATAMIADILKGLIVILISKYIFGLDAWTTYIAGAVTVIGHDYPIWLKFKGGKGVATTLGVFLGINGISGLIFLMVWFPITLITKYVSLASIIGLYVSSILIFTHNIKFGIVSLLLATLSVFKHRNNIKRLIEGCETKTDILKILLRGK